MKYIKELNNLSTYSLEYMYFNEYFVSDEFSSHSKKAGNVTSKQILIVNIAHRINIVNKARNHRNSSDIHHCNYNRNIKGLWL